MTMDFYKLLEALVALLMRQPEMVAKDEQGRTRRAPSLFDNLARRVWEREVLGRPCDAEGVSVADGSKLLVLARFRQTRQDYYQEEVYAVDAGGKFWYLDTRIENLGYVTTTVVKHHLVWAKDLPENVVVEMTKTIQRLARELISKSYAQMGVALEILS